MLGRYRPLRPLGSGGSGSVWLARDEQTGLDVALKIVPREGKAAARAEREAQAAAKLRHPSCLRAYAFARDPRHVYIAYEFVPGRTFREVLRAGELDDRAAIEACAQICDGLAHAHGAGILHRDVKPSNVLLADGDRVSVRILDFGLARMAEAETLTAQGDVPGTLAYIAPERLAGDDATGAADVWAVGVMLWESLAGRHPFWQTSMLETARAIEAGAPPLATLRPDLPKPLLQLVDRSLSLVPARRPSAHELAAHLRGAAAPRRKKRSRMGGVSLAVPAQAGRAGATVLAAGFAGSAAAALPFFPHGFAVGLAALAGAVTAVRERLGLAVALAVPILPLGNASLGLALAYVLLAAAWFVLMWPEPRSALLFALGALLAPVAALGLLPLAACGIRSPVRRAAQAGVAVLVAAVVAGIRHASLPFAGGVPPLGIGISGAGDPLDVVGSVARAAAAHPALLYEAAVLAVLAAALPYAGRRGRWGAAGLAAAMLLLTVPAVPTAAIASLVAAAWVTAIALAVRVASD
ncbi:MAG: eukaryotic-like serine/threonine-protein kinase [Gaiellaceae bacterium]|nr:eukaryotic-like serine/threonine-protein kinase [Gaiellaceae bacterium]